MSLNVTKRLSHKLWDYSEEGWVLRDGSSDQKVNDNKVVTFNCGIYMLVDGQEQYVGRAEGFTDNDVLKTNIQGVPTSMLADVSHVIDGLVAALQADN